MHFWRPHLIAIGLAAALGTLGVSAEAGQSGADPDGLITYQLTLGARQISVAHEPALRADDPAFSALLTWLPGAAESAVHLGRLEGHRALNIGTLGPGPDPVKAPSSGPSHELWLTRDRDGWALDVRPADTADKDGEDETEPAAPGRIPLTHRPRTASADMLTATLVPDGENSGQLAIRWGTNHWTSDFNFVTLPSSPTPERTSNVGPASSLTRDSDTSARYRGAALATRNETALVTPDGGHIQILFQKELGTDGDDYVALESIADGGLVQLTQAAVIRLRTEVPLQFGDTLVPTDNLAPDFPGSYGLWLKKVATDWRLVFNNEPDSWGTQHDPAFDATEIDVLHSESGSKDDQPLAVYLAPRDDGQVGLVIQWGEHLWTADFRVGQ
jgi:hypothetical protein